METTTKATEKVQASKGNKDATRLAEKAMPRSRHQQGGAGLAKSDLLSPYTGDGQQSARLVGRREDGRESKQGTMEGPGAR